MKKKIEISKMFLQKHDIFQCPFCKQDLFSEEFSLVCENRHNFSLSKKGTLFFLKQGLSTNYDTTLFASRRNMIQQGQYAPVLEVIQKYCENTRSILDIGCGEGSFLTLLLKELSVDYAVGFDLSKEGIYMATQHENTQDVLWSVADLTNLPFQTESFDTLLNIFSPIQYQEANRVLTESGKIIKIIPEQHYLKELRAVFLEKEKAENYSNQEVIDKFSEYFDITANERITYSFAIPQELQEDILKMSPLSFQQQKKEAKIDEVTIDVRILVGEKR